MWSTPLRDLVRKAGNFSRSCGYDAEIDALHLRIIGDLPGWARQHAAADLKHIGMVRDFERHLDRLLGEKDGKALAVQARQRLVHGLDHRRGEAEARLVQHQELRLA